MKLVVALLLAAVPSFLALRTSLFDPRRAEVEGLFERAETSLRAQAAHASIPEMEFVRLLPVGHWRLLVEAFPDVAFERCSSRLDDPFPDRLVASWGLHALSQIGYAPAKALLLRRMRSEDLEVRSHAIRLLRFFMDPALAPGLLARLPQTVEHAEENELAWAIFAAATSCRPADLDSVRRALDAFEKDQDPAWSGTGASRARLRLLAAPDPVREAELLLFSDPEDPRDDDFAEWLPRHAVREKLVALAPLLRRRIDQEKDSQKDSPALLDPAGSGEPLDPQRDAFWGFRGAFVLAAYRRALKDLGVPLSDEERGWLDRHRLLRPPREYLVEAGLLRAR